MNETTLSGFIGKLQYSIYHGNDTPLQSTLKKNKQKKHHGTTVLHIQNMWDSYGTCKRK